MTVSYKGVECNLVLNKIGQVMGSHGNDDRRGKEFYYCYVL